MVVKTWQNIPELKVMQKSYHAKKVVSIHQTYSYKPYKELTVLGSPDTYNLSWAMSCKDMMGHDWIKNISLVKTSAFYPIKLQWQMNQAHIEAHIETNIEAQIEAHMEAHMDFRIEAHIE